MAFCILPAAFHWEHLSTRLNALSGWKSWGAAFVLGMLLTLAFPPFHWLIFCALAFTGFFMLLESRVTPKNAFAIGWWFGFGHHTVGLYWISIAFGVDDGAFLWMVPFALFLLPAYLGLFTGAVGWAFHKFFKSDALAFRIIWLAVLWVASEWARMEFLYGFPWNQLGNVTASSSALMQGAAYVGVHGLSFWAVIAAASFALLFAGHKARAAFLAIWTISLLIINWGIWREEEMTDAAPASGALIRLVQGNIPQSLKWDAEGRYQAVQIYSELSLNAEQAPDIIIWPETAMPFPFESDSFWANNLAGLVPPGSRLVTGVVRREGEGQSLRVWNSLQALDSQGKVTAFYNKNLLVPFGEFVPLRDVLAPFGLNKVTPGTLDFSRGKGAELITLSDERGGKVQPLICYEAIFPSYRTPADQQPDWLLNITNDAWFGFSTGPYQHLAMARMRAVERGAPMVRAANTGISAVFDAYGHEKERIPLEARGVVDFRLPPRLIAPTWYNRYGDFTILSVSFLFITYRYLARRKST